MPPTHTKKPAAMRQMCAHGGPTHCSEGCYAEGGAVLDSSHREDNEKGIHKSLYSDAGGSGMRGGQSKAGHAARMKHEWANQEHRRVLTEMKADKTDRRNLAEGGDVEPLDEPMKDDGDEELENTLAGELLHAVETKDKKGIRDAIEALVLQCMNKGGSDV